MQWRCCDVPSSVYFFVVLLLLLLLLLWYFCGGGVVATLLQVLLCLLLRGWWWFSRGRIYHCREIELSGQMKRNATYDGTEIELHAKEQSYMRQ